MGSLEQVPVQSHKVSTHLVGWTTQSPLDGSQQTIEGCGAKVIIGIKVEPNMAAAAADEVG